jgi:hypothetical protein
MSMDLTYLVVDLRANQCAAGLLMVEDEQVKWHPEPISIAVHPNVAPDSRKRAGLSFYRAIGEKRWLPILTSALSDLQDGEYEVVEALFSLPKDQLDTIGLGAIHMTLKEVLKQHETLQILFLVDSDSAHTLLKAYIEKADREGRVESFSDCLTNLEGFSLLNPNLDAEPVAGPCHICSIVSPDGKENLYSWRWQDYGFAECDPQTCAASSNIHHWESRDALETAGAALFAVVWRCSLLQAMKTEMDQLRRSLGIKQLLASRATSVLERLQAL